MTKDEFIAMLRSCGYIVNLKEGGFFKVTDFGFLSIQVFVSSFEVCFTPSNNGQSIDFGLMFRHINIMIDDLSQETLEKVELFFEPAKTEIGKAPEILYMNTDELEAANKFKKNGIEPTTARQEQMYEVNINERYVPEQLTFVSDATFIITEPEKQFIEKFAHTRKTPNLDTVYILNECEMFIYPVKS